MASSDGRTIIAIDPGRSKCGIALLKNGVSPLLERSIVASEQLVVTISRMLRAYPEVSVIVIGSGTGSSTLARAIRNALPDMQVVLVDEHGTSLLARQRYLDDHPAVGWKRLVPAGLRVPNEPYDDYAALLLAERFLSTKPEKSSS
jgi:RNase H-fold protein (predicted Holliday junction resolvase)